MGKITGRPKKAVTRDKNIGFFVTQAQYFIIQQKAAQAGVNISDYLRQMSIFGKVLTRWTPEEKELFKKMVGMSNDLHQVAIVARQEGALSALLCFERYRQAMDEVIKRMGDAK
ncbi:MAG TPA: hypothetical protein VIM64_00265 [Puia sp.]